MSGGKTPEQSAAEKHCDILWPEPDQLFVDIDTYEAWCLFQDQIEILEQLEPGTTWERKPSRQWGYAHVYVRLPRPVRDNEERVMLQAMLGSDAKREMLGLKQLRAGAERTTCFFVARDANDGRGAGR